MTDQPSQTEPVPVQLTRMEGTINLIAYQFGEVKEDIKELRASNTVLGGKIAAVELVQASTTGATSSWRVWLPTILSALTLVAALGLKFGH